MYKCNIIYLHLQYSIRIAGTIRGFRTLKFAQRNGILAAFFELFLCFLVNFLAISPFFNPKNLFVYYKDRVFWARETFTHRLAALGHALNEIGLQLHFEDAFRPVGVQEGLFKRRIEWTKRDYPDWSDERIVQEAMSKTAVRPRLASHKAGAAVDARIRSVADGQIQDFGHDYPDGGAIVFPKTPFITQEQWFNRQLFHIGSQMCGLTLYVGEDWHVSFGDNLASLQNGNVDPEYIAQYGPIKAFDANAGKGEIIEIYKDNELDDVFDF